MKNNLRLPVDDTDNDNVTDWALEKFRSKYGDQISKDDIWYYIYGVMHAKDWRQKYKYDLQRELPRIPLAKDFAGFRDRGGELMELHLNYESIPEEEISCLVDGRPIRDGLFVQADVIPGTPDTLKDAFKIGAKKMKLKLNQRGSYDLLINSRCQLIDIPKEVEEYTISGRSPLKWAIETLCVNNRKIKETGVVDSPNDWFVWEKEPFELIRHLRRIIYLSLKSNQIINQLPKALDE